MEVEKKRLKSVIPIRSFEDFERFLEDEKRIQKWLRKEYATIIFPNSPIRYLQGDASFITGDEAEAFFNRIKENPRDLYIFALKRGYYEWDAYLRDGILAIYNRSFGMELPQKIYPLKSVNEDFPRAGYHVITLNSYACLIMDNMGLEREAGRIKAQGWENVSIEDRIPVFEEVDSMKIVEIAVGSRELHIS